MAVRISQLPDPTYLKRWHVRNNMTEICLGYFVCVVLLFLKYSCILVHVSRIGKKPSKSIKETLEIYNKIIFGLAENPVTSDSLFIPSLKDIVLPGKPVSFLR